MCRAQGGEGEGEGARVEVEGPLLPVLEVGWVKGMVEEKGLMVAWGGRVA